MMITYEEGVFSIKEQLYAIIILKEKWAHLEAHGAKWNH